MHDSKLDIYSLPKLTDQDQEQLKLAAADAPEANDARIQLLRPSVAKAPAPAPPAGAPTKAVTVSGNVVEQAVPEPTLAPAHVQDPSQVVGDSTPDQPRPKPSLYTPEYPKPPE